jgi:hypothetical protein
MKVKESQKQKSSGLNWAARNIWLCPSGDSESGAAFAKED